MNVCAVENGAFLWPTSKAVISVAIPKLSRVGLFDAPTLESRDVAARLEDAAETAGISLVLAPLDSPFDEADLQPYLRALAEKGRRSSLFRGSFSILGEAAAHRRAGRGRFIIEKFRDGRVHVPKMDG